MTFASSASGAARRAQRPEPKCQHRTCPGCECKCHRRPKTKLVATTPPEAFDQARKLRQSALHAIRLLDAITSLDKTRPRSELEEAVVRGNADVDAILKSPTYNGAVSGGDDPSWRMLDAITSAEVLDKNGDPITGGDLIDRVDDVALQLAALTDALDDIGTRAASAYDCVEKLRAVSPIEADQLLKAESPIQQCINCGRLVTGTENDRLKAGRCTACYQYRRDHKGNDRPAHLIAAEVERAAAGGKNP